MLYDYLIVGAGLYGATFARLMTDAGKKCLVIDSRDHIGGNCYTEIKDGIVIHKYGPHIFYTDNQHIWNFVNSFTEFIPYTLNVKAYKNSKLYSLPFNMNTFNEVWEALTGEEALKKVNSTKTTYDHPARNMEERALETIGEHLYNLLVKDYTTKLWGKPPSQLPASLINKIPLRFTYDNNYFNSKYQGIPVKGYTPMFEKMLSGIEVRLNTSYSGLDDPINELANKIVYTGPVDKLFNYELGDLEYRTVNFVHEAHQVSDVQSIPIIYNHDLHTPWTRRTEFKHFLKTSSDSSHILKEVPTEWARDLNPCYPVLTENNKLLYAKYKEKAALHSNIILGGRIGEYQYYDMQHVIASAMKEVNRELNG